MHANRRHALLALVSALAAAFLWACSSSSADPKGVATLDEAMARGPYGVGVTTYELVDESRPTEASGDFAGADDRKLVTEVWYPADAPAGEPEVKDAPPAQQDGPYPLIIFAHGFSSLARLSASYGQHLASHGYIVAAPDFPESHLGTPGGPRLGAVTNQSADVSFVIDSLIDFSKQDGHLLEGAVDGETIGVTGHSLGGLTTLLTIYGDSRDERVDAALPIAAPGCFLTDETIGDIDVPLLALGGSEDQLVRPSTVRQPYDVANQPRYYVDLIGANHIQFADIDADDSVAAAAVGSGRPDEGEDANSEDDGEEGDGGFNSQGCEEDPLGVYPVLDGERQRELLRTYAVAFFDAYLRDSDDAKSLLQDTLATSIDEAQVEFDAD
jgi:predicted dienelactone hydrolase